MHRGTYFLTLWVIVALLVGGTATARAQIGLSDIGASWAKEHIEALVSKGIVSGYPDQTFRPDRPVTRAEFAKMIIRAFDVTANGDAGFEDISRHWARDPILTLANANIVDGYSDGTFRPDAKITRAEVVSMLIRVLKLHDIHGYSETEAFDDVPRNHWAYDSIGTALRLKILPPYVRGAFKPSQAATRAETASMVRESLRLRVTRGSLDYLEQETNLVGVRYEEGVRDFTLNPETIIFRNTAVAPFDNLVMGDAIYVVSDRFGSPQFVKANGVVTQEDVATKVKNITRGLLTPNDMRAIIAGDWDALTASLKSTLYDQLVARGVTPVEAAAIMSQDWASLQLYARDHLAQVIGDQLGITSDLAAAVLDQDWDKAKNLAQVEAVQQLLGDFFIDEAA